MSRVQFDLASPATLAAAIRQLSALFPDLADECFSAENIRSGFVVSLNGDRFIQSPSTELPDGITLLFMSADAGG